MSFNLKPFPVEFSHKGEFIVYDKSWNRVGYDSYPQYIGQMSISFPEDASFLECFLGGYLVREDRGVV